jgi:hypothetical protein
MPATLLHICLSTVLGSFRRRQLGGSGTSADCVAHSDLLAVRQTQLQAEFRERKRGVSPCGLSRKGSALLRLL